jgi:putative MATE family efflux protein
MLPTDADLRGCSHPGVEKRNSAPKWVAMVSPPAGEPATVSALRAARRAQDREIARLAVPAFAALISEPLFLLADAAIVGHLGTPQLAALGIAGTIVQTAIGMFIFLAYGTTSTVARNLGSGDRRGALMVGIDGLWLAVLLGALVGALTVGLAPVLVDAFNPSSVVRTYCLTYLRIAALGIPALLLMYAATGVLRGLQDTRTPLAVAVAANILNVGLNLLFVYGLGLGIAGSAAGTLLAQGLAAVVITTVVVRASRRNAAPLMPHAPGVRAAWRAGVPLIVRTLTLRAALLLTTYVAASISTTSVAAHQVAFTIWTFLAFALDAIAIAGQAITGRLLGAGDPTGARAATGRMMQWGLLAGVGLGVLLLATRPIVVPLFTPDPDVQRLLSAVLIVAALHQPVAGVVFVLDGVLIGAGDGRYLAWAGVVNLAAFAPMALTVNGLGGGLVALWWAFTGFMVVRMGTLLWRERRDTWLVLGAAARV